MTALALVSRHHPAGTPADPAAFALTAAQHVVARAVGFSSWPRLQAYLRTAEHLRRDPTVTVDDDPLARFLSLACLTYSQGDGPARWAAADEILRANPELPARSLHAAAAVGDVVRRATPPRDPPARTRPSRAARSAGPRCSTSPRRGCRNGIRWRRRGCSSTRARTPNAGYLWLGLPTPFTVLTLCFGEGEAGPGRQPRHPVGDELAAELIHRGADPNDAQTLYNRMFSRDDDHLRILLPAGLGRGDGGPWHRRLGEALETPVDMVQRQVDWARDHGFTERLELLASYGFTAGRPASSPSPWRADPSEPPIAAAGTPAGVRALAAAGGDLDADVGGHTMLHHAAWIGDVELVEALLECGANPDVRDAEHGATPLGWAEHGHAEKTAEILRARRRT